jgi:multiple sugar transport system ATP-binding protein
VEDEGSRRFLAAGLSLPAPESLSPAASQVGIRPEHLTLVTAGSGEGSGEVRTVERLGSETLVHVLLPSAVSVVARLPGLIPINRGDPVGILSQPDSLHWFDGTGRRC